MLGESVEKKKSFKQEDVQQKLLEGGAAICYDRFGWLGSKERKEEHIDQTRRTFWRENTKLYQTFA